MLRIIEKKFLEIILLTIQGHMFEVCTMVSEIHDNVDWDIDVKIFVKLEAELSVKEL